MKIDFPYLIENGQGERIVFLAEVQGPDGYKLIAENFVDPGCGPVMHTHWLQDECLTVVRGKMGYQVKGQPVQYATVGETVLFKSGVPHRFWNDGQQELHCKGWINPPHNLVFFLSAVFSAQVKSGKATPEFFDGAFLLTRYASEFDLTEIPWIVKKVVLPLVYYTGTALGKYRHFSGAPKPVRA